MIERLPNFIGGRWTPAGGDAAVDVYNPARGVVIARTPLSTGSDLDAAVKAALKAFPEWSETPPVLRARAMFRFRQALDDHFEELARIVTTEHGKTLDEARGSVRRGIECVEVACGAPSLLMAHATVSSVTSRFTVATPSSSTPTRRSRFPVGSSR